jgi:hypothetical protein
LSTPPRSFLAIIPWPMPNISLYYYLRFALAAHAVLCLSVHAVYILAERRSAPRDGLLLAAVKGWEERDYQLTEISMTFVFICYFAQFVCSYLRCHCNNAKQKNGSMLKRIMCKSEVKYNPSTMGMMPRHHQLSTHPFARPSFHFRQ